LHSDLADFVVQSALPDMSKAHDVTTGTLLLQIMQVYDVSSSCQHLYNLIQEAKPKKGLSVDIIPPKFPRGTLKLVLTDGIQTFIGMEYTMIPGLELLALGTLSFAKLLVANQVHELGGTKIQVSHAKVRRGALVLTAQNCKVLGGFVTKLNEIHPLLQLETRLCQLLK
jgi:hypothetical protein